ncbi:hypothetical protein HF888_07730 [Bermanella marisrubri]|uniref:Uncharacterized protein n=1 Tax=Bermanella marisrubri TaxID=207949 RepID=Q1N4R1_9GAMM|nr:hypothetical protein [Bermanella marisrubri]EAT13367.1 hypothetical protein RED65_01365 [Oceanobacter sp. RED65] [Bermanella marisrubri]QIZ84122.1 hypothetical protein HF888_07730 [Bermanella marisrubri]
MIDSIPLKSITNAEMIKNFNIDRAGTRLRIIRKILGFNRPQFSAHVGITPDRLKNLEDLKQKLNETDILAVTTSWPFLADYLTHKEGIRLDPSSEYIHALASNLLLKQIDLLAKAQEVQKISDCDLVRSALVIPQFRDLLKKELKAKLASATQEAKTDAR